MSAPVSNSVSNSIIVPSQQNEDVYEIVKGLSASMSRISWIIASYLQGDELAMIYDRRLPFAAKIPYLPRHISLDDPETLSHFISKEQEVAQIALPVIRESFRYRQISFHDGKKIGDGHGMIFPMEEEVIARMMQLVKGNTFLELAGANGTLTILAA